MSNGHSFLHQKKNPEFPYELVYGTQGSLFDDPKIDDDLAIALCALKHYYRHVDRLPHKNLEVLQSLVTCIRVAEELLGIEAKDSFISEVA